jgi:hypothetical protein
MKSTKTSNSIIELEVCKIEKVSFEAFFICAKVYPALKNAQLEILFISKNS